MSNLYNSSFTRLLILFDKLILILHEVLHLSLRKQGHMKSRFSIILQIKYPNLWWLGLTNDCMSNSGASWLPKEKYQDCNFSTLLVTHQKKSCIQFPHETIKGCHFRHRTYSVSRSWIAFSYSLEHLNKIFQWLVLSKMLTYHPDK